MAKFDPVRALAKWQTNFGNATDNYRAGIQAVTESPMQKAVANQDALKQRFNQAIDNGSWAAATGAVQTQDWKNAALAGAGRLPDGAKKGLPKMQRYLQKAAPVIAQIQQEIHSMPNATDAQRKARMDRNYELMKQLKGIKNK